MEKIANCDPEAGRRDWQDRAGVTAEYDSVPVSSESIVKFGELERICLKNGLANPCNRCSIAAEALRRRIGLPRQIWEELNEAMSQDYCPEGKRINVEGRWLVKG